MKAVAFLIGNRPVPVSHYVWALLREHRLFSVADKIFSVTDEGISDALLIVSRRARMRLSLRRFDSLFAKIAQDIRIAGDIVACLRKAGEVVEGIEKPEPLAATFRDHLREIEERVSEAIIPKRF